MTDSKPPGSGEARGPYAAFAAYLGQRVTRLQGQVLDDNPRARRDLALLRRTVGRPIGADAGTWPLVFDGFPEELMGRGDLPSRWETAAHIALGLFALHLQSARRPMHVAGWGMGRAVRRLANPDDAASREKPVLRRFQALGTSANLTEAVHHARGMIQQFRSDEIPLDYVRLARDLVDLQSPRTSDAVRLRWARDLYRLNPAPGGAAGADTAQESE